MRKLIPSIQESKFIPYNFEEKSTIYLSNVINITIII